MAPVRYDFKDLEELATVGAKLFLGAGSRAFMEKGEFTVALAGGKTPRALYEKIAATSTLPKETLYLIPGDERGVPVGDVARNQTLFEQTISKAGRFLSAPEGLNPKEVSKKWSAELGIFFTNRPQKNGMPVLDLAILGMGEDGHTASIFPGMVLRDYDKQLTYPVDQIGEPPVPRVTLSMQFLRNAKERWVIVAGERKRRLIDKILSGDRFADNLPVAVVNPTAILIANQ
ncbi:MAG: 6-phosphogluconolactonase [Deltaproteobacteria bacterium]|nr:MAG: 6-phosphogluconolactonase [Deltaproteobacteria bacterium]